MLPHVKSWCDAKFPRWVSLIQPRSSVRITKWLLLESVQISHDGTPRAGSFMQEPCGAQMAVFWSLKTGKWGTGHTTDFSKVEVAGPPSVALLAGLSISRWLSQERLPVPSTSCCHTPTLPRARLWFKLKTRCSGRREKANSPARGGIKSDGCEKKHHPERNESSPQVPHISFYWENTPRS